MVCSIILAASSIIGGNFLQFCKSLFSDELLVLETLRVVVLVVFN